MHTTRLLDSQVGQKAASDLGAASVQPDLRIAFDEAARSTNKKAEYRACFSLGVDWVSGWQHPFSNAPDEGHPTN